MQGDVKDLMQYEGLVRKTSQMVEPYVEMEFDDIAQVLRIGVWRALKKFDPEQCKTDRDRWVFMCLMNQKKDVLKRKRRDEAFIEDEAARRGNYGEFRGDGFDEQYLSVRADQVYGEIEDDDVLVPTTLTQFERSVVVLLYGEFKQAEIARRLLPEIAFDNPQGAKREVEKAVRSIRTKMADWRPSAAEQPLSLAA